MGLRDKIAEEQADAFMEEIESRLETSKETLSENMYQVIHGQFKVHLTIGIKKWVRSKLNDSGARR